MSIIIKQYGQTIIFIADGNKNTLFIKDEKERNSIKKESEELVEKYNNSNSDKMKKQHLNKLKNIFGVKKEIKESESNKNPEKGRRKKEDKNKKKKIIKSSKNELSKIKELVYNKDEKEYYLKNTKVPLPDLMIQKLKNFSKKGKDYNAVLNFWKLLLLNPSSNSRENSFDYIDKNKDFIITNSGYIVGFRRVKVKNIQKERGGIPEAVTDLYFKIKSEKKSPKRYVMAQKKTNSGTIFTEFSNQMKIDNIIKKGWELQFSNETIHDLYERYINSPSDQKVTFTDGYTGKMNIHLGQAVSINRKDCTDDPNQSCSSGLHVGHFNFVQQDSTKIKGSYMGTTYKNEPDQYITAKNAIAGDEKAPLISIEDSNLNSFGNVRIAVLVNPRDIVSVPYTYEWKFRVCKYLPIAIITDTTFQKVEKLRFDVFDSDYKEYEQSEMDQLIKNAKKYQEEGEINNNLTLTAIKSILKERVIKL